MLTYDLSKEKRNNLSLYHYLYLCIKSDIESGNIKPMEKLPSKRNLAQHLQISIMTVQNAYSQLISEGYIYTVEKSGYYAANIPRIYSDYINKSPLSVSDKKHDNNNSQYIHNETTKLCSDYLVDCTGHSSSLSDFPFSAWSKNMREVLRDKSELLTEPLNHKGVYSLREALSHYLFKFKGLKVSPNNIIIGSGSEYMYGFLVKLLGRNHIFSLEEPGYGKISKIYHSEVAETVHISLDENGINMEKLLSSNADILHVSPSHHFPTGIITSASRRIELLEWVNKSQDRYIIEDDYDSEFRYQGKPVPPLLSLDTNGKVIYMNTFSKTISPSLRISYIILPNSLIEKYEQDFSYISCTVSAFEQYTLANFINNGDFERYISRSIRNNKLLRNRVIDIFKTKFKDNVEILEKDSGLHFLLYFKNMPYDDKIKEQFNKCKININLLSDYYYNKNDSPHGYCIINYSGINPNILEDALKNFDIF